MVARGSAGKTVRCLDGVKACERPKLEGHSSRVLSVAWSPDGSTVASGSSDKTVRLWDASSGRERRKLEGHSHWVRSVARSEEGRAVAGGSYDKTVRLWDAASGRGRRKAAWLPEAPLAKRFGVWMGSRRVSVRSWRAIPTGSGVWRGRRMAAR